MLKDFESEERHLNFINKERNRYKNESKKYLLRLEQMKEKKEEMLNKKRDDFLKKYSKKQKDILCHLFKAKTARTNDNKKISEKEHNKEILAQEKRKRKIENDEKDRIKIETQIFTKSKT